MTKIYLVASIACVVLAIICVFFGLASMGSRLGAMAAGQALVASVGLLGGALLWYALYKILGYLQVSAHEAVLQSKYLKELAGADTHSGPSHARPPAPPAPKAHGVRPKTLSELADEGPIYRS